MTAKIHCMGLESVIRKVGQKMFFPHPGTAKCTMHENQWRMRIPFIGKMTDNFQV